jgi:hypothetical protein
MAATTVTAVTRTLAVAVPLLIAGVAPAPRAAVPAPGNESAALAAYARALDGYMRLRGTLEWWVLPDEGIAGERVGSAEILADRMRDARRSARQGDVFTPSVAAAFRARIDEALACASGDEGEDLPLIASGTASRLPAVNGVLPPHAGERTWVSRIPELPPLPEVLEYRFVGRHLVLFDAELNLVVDVLPDVFAPRLHGRP